MDRVNKCDRMVVIKIALRPRFTLHFTLHYFTSLLFCFQFGLLFSVLLLCCDLSCPFNSNSLHINSSSFLPSFFLFPHSSIILSSTQTHHHNSSLLTTLLLLLLLRINSPVRSTMCRWLSTVLPFLSSRCTRTRKKK